MKRLYCETHKFSNYAHRALIDEEIIENGNRLVGYVPVYPSGGFFLIDDEVSCRIPNLIRIETCLEDIDGGLEKLDLIKDEVARGYQLVAVVPIEYGTNLLAVKFDMFFQRTYDDSKANEILDFSNIVVENIIAEFKNMPQEFGSHCDSLWEEIVAFYTNDEVYRIDTYPEYMGSFIEGKIDLNNYIQTKLELPVKLREFFWYLIDNGCTHIKEEEIVEYYEQDNLYRLYIKYLTYCIIDKAAGDCVDYSHYYDSEFEEDDEDDDVMEEEVELLKDFSIFKGMQKRIVKAFDLYNASQKNPEFVEFQKKFLCALDDFSNGYSVDSYNIDMFYESEDNITSVQINLSNNNLYISNGGYSKGESGGDSYTNWVIDFFAEGKVDNSSDIEEDAFDVFSEILGAEGAMVEYY